MVGGSAPGEERGLADVWRSADGASWELAAEGCPWAPRGMISGSTGGLAGKDGRRWLLGGGFFAAVLLRLGSGGAMSLVYPIACKFTATWFVKGRGTAMGAVVGATTLGSASPHLVNVLFPGIAWQTLVLVCSAASATGGLLALALLRPGPHLPTTPAQRSPQEQQGGGWRELLSSITRNRELLCAIAAYRCT